MKASQSLVQSHDQIYRLGICFFTYCIPKESFLKPVFPLGCQLSGKLNFKTKKKALELLPRRILHNLNFIKINSLAWDFYSRMTRYGDCVLKGHFIRVETHRGWCSEPFQMFVSIYMFVLFYACVINTDSMVRSPWYKTPWPFSRTVLLSKCISPFGKFQITQITRSELLCFHSAVGFLLFLRCLPHCYDSAFLNLCLKMEAFPFFSLFEAGMCGPVPGCVS